MNAAPSAPANAVWLHVVGVGDDGLDGLSPAVRARVDRAEVLVGGRGAVARGRAEVDASIEQTRGFLTGMIEKVGEVHKRGGALKEAFHSTHEHLAPRFGMWPIFEHCLPFDVQRLWDEMDGIDWPRIWTDERDREVWDKLQD